MNNNLFFNNNGLINGQDSLIEPMNQTTSTSDMNNLYLKQDFLPTNINQNTATTAATTTATNNYTQLQQQQQQQQQLQQSKGYPLIAPFQRNIFQNFDLSNANHSTPPPLAPQLPQNLTNFHKNDHAQFNTNTSTTSKTSASDIAIVAAQSAISSPNVKVPITSNSNTTTTTTDDLQTPKPSLEQTQTVLPKPKVKITGDNVTSANIEEGYIQFVLEHDASYISDGIDSLVYAKRKFQSVPKTGDISYTTWDIYQLVLKLHKQEVLGFFILN